MANYDIHWNPVRLMQRIGRVDRRMNPEIEKRLVADHPEVAASRDKVWFWNFLPPDELNEILSLYAKVTQKTLLISKTLGIEGKKLLTPEDDYAVFSFATRSPPSTRRRTNSPRRPAPPAGTSTTSTARLSSRSRARSSRASARSLRRPGAAPRMRARRSRWSVGIGTE